MVNPFVCGSHSFPREDDDDEYYDQQRQVQSAGSSPSRCKTTTRSCSILSTNKHKNPYSDRGLDKFTRLLADIEEKREKIYSQFPSEEIAFVQFDYSKDNNGKPIVVKGKPRDDNESEMNSKPSTPDRGRKHHSGPLDRHHHHHQIQPQFETKPKEKKSSTESEVGQRVESETEKNSCEQLVKIQQRFSLENLRKPGCYMSATLILILVFLAVFGRSVAIMCTSIGWYMMSTVTDSYPELKKRSPKKKALLGSTSPPQHHVNPRLSSSPASFKDLPHNQQIRSSSPPQSAAGICGMRKNR